MRARKAKRKKLPCTVKFWLVKFGLVFKSWFFRGLLAEGTANPLPNDKMHADAQVPAEYETTLMYTPHVPCLARTSDTDCILLRRSNTVITPLRVLQLKLHDGEDRMLVSCYCRAGHCRRSPERSCY